MAAGSIANGSDRIPCRPSIRVGVLMSARPHALPWLLLSLLVIVLDQWTKHVALAALEPYAPQAVIPGLLNWTLAFNPGAAFSFLAGADGWQRWLFTALAIGVSIVLAVWLSRTPRHDWRNAAPLALVIGGALGNLVDRLRFGHVVDFVQVYWREWAFPAFNIADSAISIGAVMLILFSLLPARKAS
jgi:signal peptidase II